MNLVRRGRLREEYTPIWTGVALGIMTLSVWFDIVRAITRAVGAWTSSSTLHVKLLAQEVAMPRAQPATAGVAAGDPSGAEVHLRDGGTQGE